MKTTFLLTNTIGWVFDSTVSMKIRNQRLIQNHFRIFVMLLTVLGFQQTALAQRMLDAKQNGLSVANVELKVIKASDAPHTSTEHEYLLKASNTTGAEVSLNIITTNVPCSGKKYVDLNQSIYRTENGEHVLLGKGIMPIVVPANGEVEFYVKLVRPVGTALNTWNCVEIKAVNNAQKVLSNTILIESFIPDPNDFR